jgi:hypothetical protein
MSRDQICETLLTDSPELTAKLVTAYESVKGVSLPSLIQEIFLFDSNLGKLVKDCAKRSSLVTNLAIEDRLDVAEQISGYLHYARKRQINPWIFEGKPDLAALDKGFDRRVKATLDSLNESRPKRLLFEDFRYSPDQGILRIAISREKGRLNVHQRPERSDHPDHVDYPLQRHTIEVDLGRNQVGTTFRELDRDGLSITRSLLNSFVRLKGELREAEFRSNPLDETSMKEMSESVEKLLERDYESSTKKTLKQLKKAKLTSISLKSLRLVGDLRKLDIEAGDVSKAIEHLQIDRDILTTAQDITCEMELADGRKIQIRRHNITFVGNYTAEERSAIREALEK